MSQTALNLVGSWEARHYVRSMRLFGNTSGRSLQICRAYLTNGDFISINSRSRSA